MLHHDLANLGIGQQLEQFGTGVIMPEAISCTILLT
jgi:hypothetical protein